jgi:outer membrane protein
MMKTLTRMFAGAAAIAVLADASLATAQTKPAAPAPRAAAPAAPAARPTAAPAAASDLKLTASTPGVCVLSREAVIGASKVGKYVQTRLVQLQSQATAELTGEQSSIQTAAKDLEAKKTALGDAAYQQQGQALQQRVGALQEKAQLRDRELQATDQKAQQKIMQAAVPLIEAEIKARNCAVVFDGGSILAVNEAMNLTPNVITALDGKLTQFDFDREHLDAQQAQR